MLFNTFKVKIRYTFFDLTERFPFFGKFLTIGWNSLHKFKFNVGEKILESRGQLRHISGKTDFNKINWVNPIKIQYYLKNINAKENDNSQMLNSNWTRSKDLFDNLQFYQMLKEKFEKGKTWEDFEYYHQIRDKISNNIKKYGCTNIDELDQKFKEIESFYFQIKKNGYKNREELFNLKNLEKLNKPAIFNVIDVVIDGEGQLLLVHGDLSLSISKLLGVTEIPIKIIGRHKKWLNFKKRLSYYSRNGRLYQRPTHPDLQDFPFSYGDLRFDMIKKNLSTSQGTLLDIGANFGYFCHRFEDEGFNCVAVEPYWLHQYFLKKFKKADHKKFKIFPKSIFEFNRNQELVFDIILALNIFHHFLKRKNTYLNLIKLLERLEVKEFFFGAHKPSEFRNLKVYRNYTPDQFVNFIIENSHLRKAKFIGKTKNGRSLYKLTP